jgi:hypothetical protein
VQGIEKNPRGRIEADAMLPLVAARLFGSFQLNRICIYNTAYTNPGSLRKQAQTNRTANPGHYAEKAPIASRKILLEISVAIESYANRPARPAKKELAG